MAHFSLRATLGMLVVAGAALLAAAVPGGAQQPPEQQTQPRAGTLAAIEPLRAAMEEIAATLRREHIGQDELAELRERIAAVREDLREKTVPIEQRLAEVEKAQKQLGPAPAPGAAAEDTAIAGERARLAERRNELDAALKQARLLAVHAAEHADRVSARARTLFTRELMARTAGPFDPAFWAETAAALEAEADNTRAVAASWWNWVQARGGMGLVAAAAGTLAAIAVAMTFLGAWWRRSAAARARGQTRFARASAALLALITRSAAAPLAVAVLLVILNAYGLLPLIILEIGRGLIVGVAVASFGRAVATTVLAPADRERRLVLVGDEEARNLAFRLTWSARIAGLAILLAAFHSAVGAPLALTVATSALFALGIAGFLVVARVPRVSLAPDAAPISPRLQWLRIAAWLVGIAILVSLVAGYIALASFMAGRALTIVLTLGALGIALTFVDALFTEVLTGDSPRGRTMAALFGLRPRSVELIGTLLSAGLRLLLIVVALFLILGPSGLFAADFIGSLRAAMAGIRIGEVTISLSAILTATALFFIAIVATRALQRWLEARFLPRTGIEPSLQVSVATIIGYVGFIIGLSLALAELGIDLQKIALIAGALSVGIGFGLQSVVSNFVSGLILLAERPVRVGDWIVVKGEEGRVRRISVRATEIETFDRASVIVPNSEFITGVVKNWTHANMTGRVTVKVGAAYDADPDRVREILLACAQEHPHVIKAPEPYVLFVNFGDSALEFELRCYLTNVFNAVYVKSDLHFAILRRMREAGIAIPYPQREVRIVHVEGNAAREAQDFSGA